MANGQIGQINQNEAGYGDLWFYTMGLSDWNQLYFLWAKKVYYKKSQHSANLQPVFSNATWEMD